MNRRRFIKITWGLSTLCLMMPSAFAGQRRPIEKIHRSEEEWRRLLPRERFEILRLEGTEPAGSSPLNHEKRLGTYLCAGCELPLFTSAMKYDSGTGWPSFTTSIEDHTETKTDYLLLWPRTEYHCARCGGHQGHIFNDGPPPQGKRWCNNGLALKFAPQRDI